MSYKRHRKFYSEAEKKWTEKWFKFISSNPDPDPDYWIGIYRNPNLTIEFIEAHPSYVWDWKQISRNPNITMEFIEAHPSYDWDLGQVSRNPNITMEFIEAHPEYDWDWKQISRNPNITIEFVEAHPEYDWDWFMFQCNPHLTMEFIEAHPERDWEWDDLSENEFTKNKELFMIEEAKKYMAVYKIKKWWKEIYYSPYTKIGKKRLIKSYDDFFK